MSARRRKAANGDGNGRAFAVLVEEMRGHFKVYGEALESVRGDVHELKQDVHGLKQDVQSLHHEVDTLRHDMQAGFQQVDRRLDRVEAAVLEHTRELKALRVAVDPKVDRDEVVGIVERVVAGRSPGQKG